MNKYSIQDINEIEENNLTVTSLDDSKYKVDPFSTSDIPTKSIINDIKYEFYIITPEKFVKSYQKRAKIVMNSEDLNEAFENVLTDCMEHPVLALDCEWYVDINGHVAILQLCTYTGYCALIKICELMVPNDLREILEDKRIVKLGSNIEYDCPRLHKKFQISVERVLDLKIVNKKVFSNASNINSLTFHLFEKYILKYELNALSDWRKDSASTTEDASITFGLYVILVHVIAQEYGLEKFKDIFNECLNQPAEDKRKIDEMVKMFKQKHQLEDKGKINEFNAIIKDLPANSALSAQNLVSTILNITKCKIDMSKIKIVELRVGIPDEGKKTALVLSFPNFKTKTKFLNAKSVHGALTYQDVHANDLPNELVEIIVEDYIPRSKENLLDDTRKVLQNVKHKLVIINGTIRVKLCQRIQKLRAFYIRSYKDLKKLYKTMLYINKGNTRKYVATKTTNFAGKSGDIENVKDSNVQPKRKGKTTKEFNILVRNLPADYNIEESIQKIADLIKFNINISELNFHKLNNRFIVTFQSYEQKALFFKQKKLYGKITWNNIGNNVNGETTIEINDCVPLTKEGLYFRTKCFARKYGYIVFVKYGKIFLKMNESKAVVINRLEDLKEYEPKDEEVVEDGV